MKEWHNFLRSYLKSPEQLKKNKKLNEVFWTQYAVYTAVKMKSLVKNNKMDDALRLLSEFDLNISKFDLNPDEIPGYLNIFVCFSFHYDCYIILHTSSYFTYIFAALNI